MPSLVPGSTEDFYIVLNSYGRHGTAFAETDINRADYETTVDDLLTGQYSDPLRVIRFNPETNQCEDVSLAVAQTLRYRISRDGRDVPPELEDFFDRYPARDHQLMLRLSER